jgi:hypothetical protein
MNPGNGAGQHVELDPHSGLVRARMQLGDFELTVCTDGTYKLDGGAMFGVVPKPLWERRAAADDQNRILLGHTAQLMAVHIESKSGGGAFAFV